MQEQLSQLKTQGLKDLERDVEQQRISEMSKLQKQLDTAKEDNQAQMKLEHGRLEQLQKQVHECNSQKIRMLAEMEKYRQLELSKVSAEMMQLKKKKSDDLDAEIKQMKDAQISML